MTTRTREWYERRALAEEHHDSIAAGRTRIEPAPSDVLAAASALALVVHLRRRERGMSVEELAQTTHAHQRDLVLLEHAAFDPQALGVPLVEEVKRSLSPAWLLSLSHTLELPHTTLRDLWDASPDAGRLWAEWSTRFSRLASVTDMGGGLSPDEQTTLQSALGDLAAAGR